MRLDFIFLMLSFSVVQHFMLMFLCNHHVGVVICLELLQSSIGRGTKQTDFLLDKSERELGGFGATSSNVL